MSDEGLAGLEIPETPAGVPYREREDAFALALLEVNGRPTDDASVLGLLDASSELFAGAAARLAGARGLGDALPRLRELAASPDDLLAVHAAAGLTRLDPDAGRAELARIAALPYEGAPGAIQAAGELARLGDASAAPTAYAALDSTNPVLRTIAAKQLLFLADAGEPAALDRISRPARRPRRRARVHRDLPAGGARSAYSRPARGVRADPEATRAAARSRQRCWNSRAQGATAGTEEAGPTARSRSTILRRETRTVDRSSCRRIHRDPSAGARRYACLHAPG